MKKFNLLTLVFLFLVITAFAQTTGERSIAVTGTSHLSVTPDQVVVHMNIQALEMEFSDAIKTLNKKTDKLINTLEKGGFDQENMKIINFSVHKNIRYDRGKSYDSGYVAVQSVILKFDYTKDKLADLVKTYSKSPVDANLNFNFQLSEQSQKTNRNQLIIMAVDDAKAKARVIAGASGVTLGKIISIQYGVDQNSPQPVQSFSRMKAMSSDEAGSSSDLSLQNVDLYDEVNISWEIQ